MPLPMEITLSTESSIFGDYRSTVERAIEKRCFFPAIRQLSYIEDLVSKETVCCVGGKVKH